MRHVVFAICLIASPLCAQAPEIGRWMSGPTEFTDSLAWVIASSGGQRLEAGSLCAGDVPYFYFNVPKAVWWSYDAHIGIMRLSVDGQLFESEARYNPFEAEPAWNMRLTKDAIAALSAGTQVDATVVGLSTVTFGLRGSSAALAMALEGCGEGRGHHPDWNGYFTLLEPDESGTLRPVSSIADIPNVSVDAAQSLDARAGGDSSTVTMRASVDARIQEACRGSSTLGDGALQMLQIDDDDLPDLVLNWGLVDCADPSIGVGAGSCGMHMCSHDIYLSSAWQVGDWPKSILALGVLPGDPVNGIALRSTRMGGPCPRAEICETVWRWTGSDIEAIR